VQSERVGGAVCWRGVEIVVEVRTGCCDHALLRASSSQFVCVNVMQSVHGRSLYVADKDNSHTRHVCFVGSHPNSVVLVSPLVQRADLLARHLLDLARVCDGHNDLGFLDVFRSHFRPLVGFFSVVLRALASVAM